MSLSTNWLRRLTVAFTFLAAAYVSAGDSLVERLPQGAVVSAELTDTAILIERLRESEVLKAIIDSEPYKKWADSGDGRKFRGGRAVLEGQLGLNLWDAATRLLGDRVAVALYAPTTGKQPDGVLVIRLGDDEAGALIREKVQPWIELADGQVITSEQDGRWLLETKDGKAFGGLQQRWLVLSSTQTLRDGTFSKLADFTPGNHAENRVRTTRLSATLDNAALRAVAGKDRLIPSKVDNPLGSLLIGGLSEVAALCPALHADIAIGESGYELSLKSDAGRDGVDAPHQTLLAAAGDAPLTPAVPRQLGGFALCREWAEWYRQRDQLLEAHVLPEYDKFETGLSTFLPGKDFAEDVLALLKTPMSFVAAAQTYPHLDGKPGMQLPAFAVVLELQDPQKGADVFQLFFQTLGTIVNIEAGKNGRQPWVLSSEAHAGVQISYAKYLERPQGDDLPVVFNVQPAAGLVGNRYVAASSLELCRDLIDSLQRTPEAGDDQSATGRNFEFTLDPQIGASLLDANRAIFTAKGVQDGKSLEQASQELDGLLKLLQHLTPVSIITAVTGSEVEVKLEGGWR